MDCNAAIEENREALKRVLAMLVAMAGLGGGSPATLPRHLHRAILRLLRPAESAARRLIIVVARGLVVTLAPTGPRKPKPSSTILRNGIGTGIVMPRGFRPLAGLSRTLQSSLALPLFDRLPRWGAPPRPPASASGFPRISVPGLTQPCPVPRAPSPDNPVDATRLALRLGALASALDDLPARQGASRAGERGRRMRRASPTPAGFAASGPCVPAVRPAAAWRVTIRTPHAGRTSATSTRSWRTPTHWPASRSAPIRHDAGGCLCRTRRKGEWPDCRNAGRGNDEARLSSPPERGRGVEVRRTATERGNYAR